FADALAQELVHGRYAGFAVELNKVVALCHDFKFALDHGLVADERPIEIVRKRHVASGFPIADGLCFLELARERRLRPDIKPEGKIWPKGHGVKATQIVAIDAANNAASNEREDKTVSENHCARTQSRQNAVFDLVEKVGGVHQGERQAGDGVFGEQLIDVA